MHPLPCSHCYGVDASGTPSNFVFPSDYSFWHLLNEVIQEEPSEGSNPTTLGVFASSAIEGEGRSTLNARIRKSSRTTANIGAVPHARLLQIRTRRLLYSTMGGHCRSSAATSSKSHRGSATWMGPPSFTIWPRDAGRWH